MNNWDLYKITNYLTNKTQQGNTYTSAEFQLMLNHSSFKRFKQLLGLPEEYRPMQPYSSLGYAETTRLLIDLAPFVTIKEGDTAIQFTNGLADIPSDMAYPIGMIYKAKDSTCDGGVDYRVVELLNEGEYVMRKSSLLIPINYHHPVYMVTKKLRIVPNDILYSDFTYIKYPSDAVIATTTNSTTGEIEYDSTSSVELEWGDMAKIDILSILLSSVGLNLRSQDIVQAAESLKIKGV